MILHLVGDLHGHNNPIHNLVKHAELLPDHQFIQVGDFGVAGSGWGCEDYPQQWLVNAPSNLKVLAGNHDDYETLAQFPHNLGRFGVHYVGNCKCFYVQGAHSIDKGRRRPGIDWWPTEELNLQEAHECYELWKKECYDVQLVITHDAPANVGSMILGFSVEDSITTNLLYDMWKFCESPYWRFGHHHQTWDRHVGATHFRCLNINEIETMLVGRSWIELGELTTL